VIPEWTGTSFPGMPFIFTEDNWATQPKIETACTSLETGCPGTYLDDLFTWLYDTNEANPATSPVRMAWYTGADVDQPLGIYYPLGQEKVFTTPDCPNVPAAQGKQFISNNYYNLEYYSTSTGFCY
jgi:hypothetical protein